MQVSTPACGYMVNRPQISLPDKGDVNKDLHNNPVTFEQNPVVFEHSSTNKDVENKNIRHQRHATVLKENAVLFSWPGKKRVDRRKRSAGASEQYSLWKWHSLTAWHTKSAASHSCAVHARDDIMLGQLGLCCSAFDLQLPFACSNSVPPLSAGVLRWPRSLWRGAAAAVAPQAGYCTWRARVIDCHCLPTVIKRAAGSDTCQGFDVWLAHERGDVH